MYYGGLVLVYFRNLPPPHPQEKIPAYALDKDHLDDVLAENDPVLQSLTKVVDVPRRFNVLSAHFRDPTQNLCAQFRIILGVNL